MVKEIKSTFNCKKSVLEFKKIPVCSYQKNIGKEIKDGTLSRSQALSLLEMMNSIRTLEDMLVRIKAGIPFARRTLIPCYPLVH